MTLQKRITVILGALFLCFFLILNYFINAVLLDRFVVLEEQKIQRDFERIRNAYEADLDKSQTLVKDWSEWTDTYRFIGGEGRDAYINNNLMDDTFTLTKMNLIAFVDTKGRVNYAKTYDLEKGKAIALPGEFKDLAGSGAILAPREKSGRKGIVVLNKMPMLFYSWSILTNEGKGPMRGTLVMGRFFTKSELGILSGVTQLPLTIIALDDPQLPEAIKNAASVVSDKFKISILRDSETKINGYMLFRDIKGRPAFVLKFEQPRSIYLQGRESIHIFKLFSIGAALVFLFVMLFLMQKQVISRVAGLSKSFGIIAGSADFSARVPAAGKDELANLSADINRTLEVMENAHVALQKSEEKHRLLAVNTLDLIWQMDLNLRFTYCNPAIFSIFGYTPEEFIGSHLSAYCSMEQLKRMYDIMSEKLVSDDRHTGYVYESEHFHKSGGIIPVEIHGSIIFDDAGMPKGFQGTTIDITGRKRADEALRESRERLELALKGANLALWDLNIASGMITYNRRWAEMLGFPQDGPKVHVSEWAKLVHPDDVARMTDILNSHFWGDSPSFEMEHRVRGASGDWIWVHDCGRVVSRDAKGNPSRAAGTLLDITERKRADEALREAISIIERSLAVAFLWKNEEGWPVEFVSLNVETLFGYAAEDFISGRVDFSKTIHPEDIGRVTEEVESYSGEKGRITFAHEPYRIIARDGQIKWVDDSTFIRRDENGAITHYQGIVIDITERKRAEEALRESDARFRVLFEGSPIGVSIIRREEILYANRAFAEIHGYDSPSELVGTSFLNLLAPLPREKIAGEMNANPEPAALIPVVTEIESLKKSGEIFPAFVTASRIELADGPATVAFVSDISEFKQMEHEKETLQRQLLQAQKMESIGTLAGGVAHDFNNMLAVILGNAQLAKMDMPRDDQGRVALEEIEQAALRAKDLTMKLLTFARKEKLNVRNVSVNGILKDLAAMLNRSISKKIEIRTKLVDDSLAVSVDVNQMQQVFLNICNNACDAMPSGGVLTIESSKVLIDETYAKQHVEAQPGEYCLVRIGDTGIGMIEDVRKRVFDPFFTTKGAGKGTGLGLSISYGIVKSHGGTIGVYSEPGKGADFKIYLPLAKGAMADKEPENLGEAVLEGSETILVVDDEASVLDLSGRILEKAGYTALLADGGKNAVQLYRERGDEIALVVLDMIMPGMDGSDVYKALRKINPDVKVVLSSGFSVDGQAGALMSEGVLGFIQKPYRIDELCNTVRRVIDGSQAGTT
ncbi:MAG: PAS domain S-box protein [bacterium]